jgi:hypothetical protein
MKITNGEYPLFVRPLTFNYENKTLAELKDMRTNFNLKEIRPDQVDTAYLIRMIDILLDKIEALENE